MTRYAMALIVLLLACTSSEPEDREVETEAVPIGPGTDSSTLIPPDTPVSHREPSSMPRPVPDSLR